jgi:hypothetical protein
MSKQELGYVSNLFVSSDVCSENSLPMTRINMDKIPGFLRRTSEGKAPTLKGGTLLISLAKEEINRLCNMFPKEVSIIVNKEGEEVGIAGTTILLKAVTIMPGESIPYDKLTDFAKKELEKEGWLEEDLRKITENHVLGKILNKGNNISPKNVRINSAGNLITIENKVIEIHRGAKTTERNLYDDLPKYTKVSLEELGWKEDDLKRVYTLSIFDYIVRMKYKPKQAIIDEKGFLKFTN